MIMPKSAWGACTMKCHGCCISAVVHARCSAKCFKTLKAAPSHDVVITAFAGSGWSLGHHSHLVHNPGNCLAQAQETRSILSTLDRLLGYNTAEFSCRSARCSGVRVRASNQRQQLWGVPVTHPCLEGLSGVGTTCWPKAGYPVHIGCE